MENGAFVGAFPSIRDGSRIAPGAIVGAGARLEQRTQVWANGSDSEQPEL